MARLTVLVTWAPGAEDTRPVTICTSRLPGLLGHDGVTLRRTVRVRNIDVLFRPMAHAPFLRHELAHIPQQPEAIIPWLWWLAKYICLPRFRRAMEAEASMASFHTHPTWRTV
jgi:hypothetical protein